MKKFVCALILPVLLLTSCYNVKVAVGDVNPNQPMVKVASEKNHFLVAGLIPIAKDKLNADEYVGERKDYVVKTNISFVDGLANFLTLGIYSPTTTSFYLPLNRYGNEISSLQERGKAKQKQAYDYLNDYEESTHNEYDAESAQITNRRDYNYQKTLDYIEVEETVIEEEIAPERSTRIQTYDEPIQHQNKSTQTNEYKGIIYFKDGAKMNATVTEYPSGDIFIKLPDGKGMELNMTDILRIERQ